MLTYDMNQRGDCSRYEYMYRCVRHDIESGAISAGEKLPSKRSLAKHLGVSLVTVESAYAQLIAEGYVRAEERRGYFAESLPVRVPPSSYAPPSRSLFSDGSCSSRDARFAKRACSSDSFLPPHASSARAHAKSCGSKDVSREAFASEVGFIEVGFYEGGSSKDGPSEGGSSGGDSFVRSSTSPASGASHGEFFAEGDSSARNVSRETFAAPLLADFTSGSMPAGLFPFNAWVKAMREALSYEPENLLLGETPAIGLVRLRRAIADYLRGFRGMVVDPDCVVVGAGAQVLYNMIVQLLGRSRCYAVEDPGYPRLTSIYRANDASVAHVPLDEDGISVAALRESGASVAHIMPSHQFPTGLVTSAARRFELLEWASAAPNHSPGCRYDQASDCALGQVSDFTLGQASDYPFGHVPDCTLDRSLGHSLDLAPVHVPDCALDRYLIEDDYDCEFRFFGRPVPSLASVDSRERVIYTNTFTKSLGPAFRIGYMVLPPHLMRRFADELGFYSCTVSAVDQLALARFIENGTYERHVNRMRKRCRTIKDQLTNALRNSAFGAALGDRLRFEALDSGLHFVMAIDGVDEVAFAEAARREGVALAPLSSFRVAAQPANSAQLPISARANACSAGESAQVGDAGVQSAGSSCSARQTRPVHPAHQARPTHPARQTRPAYQARSTHSVYPVTACACSSSAGVSQVARFIMNYAGLDPAAIPAVVSVLSHVISDDPSPEDSHR